MGSSKSKSSSATTYTSTDTRGVADNGSMLVTGSNNALDVQVESVDAEIINNAIDTIAGEGFGGVLELAAEMLESGRTMVADTQKAALSAYSQATTEKAGTVDNKTIIVLAIAGAAALVLAKGK